MIRNRMSFVFAVDYGRFNLYRMDIWSEFVYLNVFFFVIGLDMISILWEIISLNLIFYYLFLS